MIRTDRIGDVVLSTPVATALKQAFPQIEVIFLAREYTKPLLQCHRDIDDVWTEENLESSGNPIEFLKKNRVFAGIALHPDLKWAWRLWRARVPLRVGTAYRAFSLFYNVRVFEHRKHSSLHEAEHNLRLLEPFGIKEPQVAFHFELPDLVLKKAEELLISSGINPRAPFVVLHPGSGGSAVDWPVTSFGKLARRLLDERIPVVVTGSKEEKSLAAEILRNAGSAVQLAGTLNLLELAAVLKLARVVVANSTGPLHIAVALGTEVVGLYCPVPPCHPARWGPYGRPDSVLVPQNVHCRSCGDKACTKNRCMEQISVESVLEKVNRKLQLEK